MKRNRSQYRRIWTAAARTIQNHDDQPSNVCSCDPLFVPAFLPNSQEISGEEEYEPSLKRVSNSEGGSSSDGEVLAEMSDDIQCGSSDLEEDVNDDGLPNGLANWANGFLIKHNALDSLLVLLKNNGLPGSARTLLKTTRNVPFR